MLRIEYLADRSALVPVLAEWHHREWSHFAPGETVEDRARRLRDSARCDRCPLTVVALSGDALLGSASLVPDDMAIRRQLTPWLAALYVAPAHRRRGVGSALVHRIVAEAVRLAVPRVYLFTTSQQNEDLYRHVGWKVRERVEYLGKMRVVMEIEPSPIG